MIPFSNLQTNHRARQCALSENDSVSEVSIIVGISVILVMRKRIFFFCIFFFYTFINEKSFYLNAIGESTDN